MYESVTTDPDRSIMDSPIYDPEDAGIAPETSAPSPGSPGSNAHLKGTASSSSPKRSRRSVQKRVVTIPIVEAEGSPRLRGGAGDGAPPSDSWAWRKYGQKPIKGSPYPRGYYRCSSSKGCPARKQVERSRTDPTMLVVTYACDHNHSWPPPRNNHHQHHHRSAPAATNNSDEPVVQPTRFSPAGPDDKFPDLMIREEPPASDYYWFSDVAVGSPSATSSPGSSDDLLLGPIVVSSADVAAMTFSNEELGGGEEYEEELFAGLGELPECSVVFGRKLLVER